MFGDKDKRGHKLGSRLSSIFTGDNDGHKLHVPTIRTDGHTKSSSVSDRALPPKNNLLKQSIVNSSASRTSKPTTSEAKSPKSNTSTPKYQTRSLLDPGVPKVSPEASLLGVQNTLSPQTSPQSNSSRLRRKPPPDLDVEPRSGSITPNFESMSNNSSFDDFQFNVGPHQQDSKTPEPVESSPKKSAAIDELINQIDTQLESLDVESEKLPDRSSNKANRYAKIPRSPNMNRLSDYNHSNTSSLTDLLSRPLESSTIRKDDTFTSEPNSPIDPSKDNRWENFSKESDTSSLQSPFTSESRHRPGTDVLENSSIPSVQPTSPQKDLFLNYSSSPDHRSRQSFNISSMNDFDSRSEGLDDFSRYQSLESLNGDMKPETSGFGGFINPEEYKLSFQTSVENPIIENQEMASAPYMESPTQEVPYPISTPEPQSPISPQISLGDINRDFSKKDYTPSERLTIGTYGDFSNKGLDSPADATQPFSRTLSNISSPSSRQPPYRPNPLQPVLSSPIEPSISQSSIKRHRQTSSISSIFSINSNRPANLATIKKSLNLKPGEGERSNYVVSIRRSAGTAYNENGPGKWNLPIGIRPVDKSASAMNANGKYMRLAGPFSQNKLKKTSGVEFKHGHLQPRLLAGEIDDSYTTGTKQKIGVIGDTKTQLGDIKSSDSSITPSTTTTLNRTTTGGSINTNDIGSVVTSSSNASPRKRTDSIESSSSGSLSDAIGEGFYQHPGYKYSDRDEDDTEVEMHGFVQDQCESMEYEERPKLKLANPDIDTDSD